MLIVNCINQNISFRQKLIEVLKKFLERNSQFILKRFLLDLNTIINEWEIFVMLDKI